MHDFAHLTGRLCGIRVEFREILSRIPVGLELSALEFRAAGHFQLDDPRMDILVTACRIHNGGEPQTDPTIGVCLDADRLSL